MKKLPVEMNADLMKNWPNHWKLGDDPHALGLVGQKVKTQSGITAKIVGKRAAFWLVVNESTGETHAEHPASLQKAE